MKTARKYPKLRPSMQYDPAMKIFELVIVLHQDDPSNMLKHFINAPDKITKHCDLPTTNKH